jgi:hypothetical protein
MSSLRNELSAPWRLRLAIAVASVTVACGSAAGADTGSAGSSGATGGPGGSASSAVGAGGSTAAAGGSGLVSGGSGGASVASGCGYAKVPTFREPGALLLVVDQSSSMEEDAAGKKSGDFGYDKASSKWTILTTAVASALGQLPKDANVGLFLFPTNFQGEDWCSPDMSSKVPQIGVGPLSQTGPAILSQMSPSSSPSGSVTPLAQALYKGLLYLNGLPVKGTRAALLVTDGAPSALCGKDGNETADYAANAYKQAGLETFVIGLDGSAETLLSRTAHGGHTDRKAGCNPDCCSDLLCKDADNCCHYTAKGSQSAKELAAALQAVAAQALTSCVFAVPKNSDPSKYDSDKVNVLVTPQGGMAQLVPKDPSNGWEFTNPAADQIVINGPACDAILASPSTVEILLGCPTGTIY